MSKSTEANGSSAHDSLPGLPPVTPPSGKFIAQLFLVPGLIVTVAVGCIWFVSWLVGGLLTPDQFLKDLRSGNAEVRWRRASDLAQVLKRDPALAANGKFALDLAELLKQSLRDSEISEKSQAERMKTQSAAAKDAMPPKELQDERAFIEFLIASIGNFSVPAGVPVLNEIALKEDGADPATVALRRQLAVWSLANLGENLHQFDKLPAEKKTILLNTLETEGTGDSPERSQWAKETLANLQARMEGKAQAMGVDVTLARTAAADDPTLRKFTALALTFWEGTPEESARMEQTLLALSKDDGHGTDLVALAKKDEGAAVSEGVRGREIRYQATQALARRGSTQVASRLGVLQEMLDEETQAKAFQTRLKDGREVADGATVGTILTGALKSVAELHKKQPDMDLAKLYPAIDKLAESKNPALRTEAERTQVALNRK